MLLGLLAGCAAATLFGLASVLQAHAVRRQDTRTDSLLGFVRASMTDPRVLLVVAAFLGGFGLHAVAIWLLPLYLAQATIALALPVAAVASSLVSERLHPRDWLAVALVAMGIVLLAMGSGKPGEVRPSLLALALLGAAVIGTAVVVMVSRHVNGWLLGILAGAVYAGSAVSVRGIRWPLMPPPPLRRWWCRSVVWSVSGSTPWRWIGPRYRSPPRRWWSVKSPGPP